MWKGDFLRRSHDALGFHFLGRTGAIEKFNRVYDATYSNLKSNWTAGGFWQSELELFCGTYWAERQRPTGQWSPTARLLSFLRPLLFFSPKALQTAPALELAPQFVTTDQLRQLLVDVLHEVRATPDISKSSDAGPSAKAETSTKDGRLIIQESELWSLTTRQSMKCTLAII